jgi:uridine kinase
MNVPSPRVIVIGVAGGSGAGKSTLARALAARLGADAQVLAEDDYYHCCTNFPDFDAGQHDFDSLPAKDMPLLAQHLVALKAGRAIEKPVSDFTMHRRVGSEPAAPCAYLILEGILALADRDVRRELDLAIWLDASEALRLERRIRRDTSERGRTKEDVLAQFAHRVRPAFARYEALQRTTADLVLDSEALGCDYAIMVERVLTALKERLR